MGVALILFRHQSYLLLLQIYRHQNLANRHPKVQDTTCVVLEVVMYYHLVALPLADFVAELVVLGQNYCDCKQVALAVAQEAEQRHGKLYLGRHLAYMCCMLEAVLLGIALVLHKPAFHLY